MPSRFVALIPSIFAVLLFIKTKLGCTAFGWTSPTLSKIDSSHQSLNNPPSLQFSIFQYLCYAFESYTKVLYQMQMYQMQMYVDVYRGWGKMSFMGPQIGGYYPSYTKICPSCAETEIGFWFHITHATSGAFSLGVVLTVWTPFQTRNSIAESIFRTIWLGARGYGFIPWDSLSLLNGSVGLLSYFLISQPDLSPKANCWVIILQRQKFLCFQFHLPDARAGTGVTGHWLLIPCC